MDNVRVFDDQTQLAEATAEQTIAILRAAIDEYDNATWVLAGGSTPLLAYKIIASKYKDAIDWEAVTIVIGDERIGPLDGLDNNWHAIDDIIGELPTIKTRPMSDLDAEAAAEDYTQQLMNLPKADNGLPRFDLLWLGVGQDGHTMSLFPQHSSLQPSSELVVAVHDSPKPPLDRISLSLRAVQGAQNTLIIASGKDKQAAVTTALKGGSTPIALVASIIETHEANVSWLLDRKAAPTD